MKRIYGLCMCILLAVVVTACSNAPKPEETMDAYIQAWNKQKFADMYEMLSESSKKSIAKDAFVQRYEKIYSDIEVENLQVKLQKEQEDEKDEKDAAVRHYELKMETMAGPISFQNPIELVKEKSGEEEKWKIEWKTTHIFPDMKAGDKVGIDTYEAKRGEILDRSGNGLAINGTVPQAGIVPEKLGADAEATKEALAKLLGITVEEINQKLSAKWVKPNLFVPIGFFPEGANTNLGLPGVGIKNVPMRVYPLKEAAAHITGYVQEITAEQLETLAEKGYKAGDIIGKAGLEQVYEDELHGENGARLYIIDENKKEKEELAKKEAVDGKTISVTLDGSLQQSIYAQLNSDAGTAAAVHPSTGEVLALVSSPSYNPNAFVRGVKSEQWNAWNNDPKKPLLNRFTKAYTPGSVFKPITAMIGLKEGILDPAEQKKISGLKWAKDTSWGNYYVTRVHEENSVDLEKAFVYSDNIYFAQEALQIGKEAFTEGAKAVGLGEKLPLKYPFQASQLANDEIKGDIELADTAYGQGEVLMTPLHVALTYAPIVNNGAIPAPVLVKEQDQQKVWKENVVSAEQAELLKKALVAVVNNPEGTGKSAKLANKLIAGKTGTAELKQGKNETGQENGWFTGFNAANPDVIIAMMVEDVKERGGSSYVAEKVRNVLAAR